jgi:two-component system, chemotaxis family, CheB/CheR fusion protein
VLCFEQHDRTFKPGVRVTYMMDAIPVVAVASDAGDLEAVAELLSALAPECGAALIVVQDLDAAREKLLAVTLAKRTRLPVLRAQDGVLPQRDHIYVIGANESLTMAGGRIRVTRAKATELHRCADILFTSLAEELGAHGIGVVLSGAGSDGANGIRALKQRGAATLAQYPGSARFPSMPISAIETGCVDLVLRPYEIARELARLSCRARTLTGVAPRALMADAPAALPPGRATPTRSAVHS